MDLRDRRLEKATPPLVLRRLRFVSRKRLRDRDVVLPIGYDQAVERE